MTALSLRGAIDAKCRDCGAADAGVNWREHITCCPATDCPLWRVRPLSRNVPSWLSSREARALPPGWRTISQETALATMRNAPERGPRVALTVPCAEKHSSGGAARQPETGDATSAPEAVTEGAP